jgi:hypothetical protein
LHLADQNDRVVALKDDLAVGPLNGVDDAPQTRAAFWHHVLASHTIDFDG